ncbi:DUF2007 domain-containing protein [Hymenobacter sp. RP-2-7]|uniref:DUF2007 domain-containing protein n=1 Tax=Hymenobacter polaris TaxID=2682546 RepID=A0A7Y0AEF6_9BACT|nr:DUF2007 domain-containing protein [Hymenobacter polaris]NML65796.1 DUF2007 domain-containing protein [Hymenobacter polaris]
MASATENIIVLGTYYEPVAAHLARTQLEAAGIACFLSNENLVSLNRMYSPVAGGVRLHVYARDAPRAAEVLRELPHMHAERGGLAAAPAAGVALTCPRCGSAEVGRDEEAAQAGTGSWWAGLRTWLRRNQLLATGANHCFGCGLNF